MAIYQRQGQQKNGARAIVTEDTGEYGLYMGPEGAFGKAGLQAKATKWSYLFTPDPDGVINLTNVLQYLEQNCSASEWMQVRHGLEKFLVQSQKYIS